jgi:hypothetical protein
MLRVSSGVLVVLLAVSGCMTEPEDVPLSGTWTGNATFGGAAISFVWELRESAGVIAGSASYTVDPLTVTGDVTGSYTHPNVRMTLVVHYEPGDTFDLRWVGTRTNDDVLSGVLHDPDGGQTSLTLRRG